MARMMVIMGEQKECAKRILGPDRDFKSLSDRSIQAMIRYRCTRDSWKPS